MCAAHAEEDNVHWHLLGGRMPYIFVRENAIKYWCTVQGLNHNEVRILAEKVMATKMHSCRYLLFDFIAPSCAPLRFRTSPSTRTTA